jgi:hypothetical protein
MSVERIVLKRYCDVVQTSGVMHCHSLLFMFSEVTHYVHRSSDFVCAVLITRSLTYALQVTLCLRCRAVYVSLAVNSIIGGTDLSTDNCA